MPRGARRAPGGWVYHVLNRAVARLPLFQKDGDYWAFEKVMEEALAKHPTRVLAYCVMPNHWHMVLWPRRDGEVTAFLRWLTHTHTMRWHAYHQTRGTGHLYQGRFKAFPVQTDGHFYRVVRYVERNPLRANLVSLAEQWRWSSLWRRRYGNAEMRQLLTPWPVPLPGDWVASLTRPETEAELQALRNAVQRGSPYGSEDWRQETALELGLETSVRRRGRPRKRGRSSFS